MRWRSAVVSFGGLGAIVSGESAVPAAVAVGETVCKTCRCRFCTATAEESERLIESIDQIHNIVAGSLGISRNLLREIRALYRDGRDKPRGQSTESKKGDGEK